MMPAVLGVLAVLMHAAAAEKMPNCKEHDEEESHDVHYSKSGSACVRYTRDAYKYCGNWREASTGTQHSVAGCEAYCTSVRCHSGYYDNNENKCYVFGGSSNSKGATCNHNTARATDDGSTRFTARTSICDSGAFSKGRGGV